MTLGSPPSMTETHEFVVPRSMPMTLPIALPLWPDSGRYPDGHVRLSPDVARESSHFFGQLGSAALHLDVTRPCLIGLRYAHLEHTVLVRRLHLVAADRRVELEPAFERAVGALDAVRGAVLL